jgi:hypothetical protein
MIYEGDSALDKEAEDFEALFKEYLENLDETKLPMKAGQTVTRFKLRHIRGKAKRQLQDEIRINYNASDTQDPINLMVTYLACQIALVEVQNCNDAKGKEFKLGKTYDKGCGFDVVSEECMRELNDTDDGGLVNQLGIRAIMSLSPGPNS